MDNANPNPGNSGTGGEGSPKPTLTEAEISALQLKADKWDKLDEKASQFNLDGEGYVDFIENAIDEKADPAAAKPAESVKPVQPVNNNQPAEPVKLALPIQPVKPDIDNSRFENIEQKQVGQFITNQLTQYQVDQMSKEKTDKDNISVKELDKLIYGTKATLIGQTAKSEGKNIYEVAAYMHKFEKGFAGAAEQGAAQQKALNNIQNNNRLDGGVDPPTDPNASPSSSASDSDSQLLDHVLPSTGGYVE